jgi:hypothetical protein
MHSLDKPNMLEVNCTGIFSKGPRCLYNEPYRKEKPGNKCLQRHKKRGNFHGNLLEETWPRKTADNLTSDQWSHGALHGRECAQK